MKYGFGVDLGGTTVKIAFFSAEGEMLDKWEIPTDISQKGERILPDIAMSVLGYLEKKGFEKTQVLGIGIGVPGPVNGRGVVNECHNLGWGVTDVRQVLSDLTSLPVQVGNDANMAALGELWKGGGQGCENMVLATFGTGVGGGIIVDGRPLNGAHGAAGEIGHLVLYKEEPEYCTCGKQGCVEQYCSATGIVRLAKQYLEQSSQPSLLRAQENLTCKAVFDAGKAGDSLAEEILQRVYDDMGRFLADVCCVIDPEVIVLGGGVSRAGMPMLEGAERAFQKYAFPACRETRFALAKLGNDAGAWGAFKLVLDQKQ